MKIESKVVRVYRYDAKNEPDPRSDWIFSTGNDVIIPFGADVTVEWDETSIHHCDELDHLGLKVQCGIAAKWAWWAGEDQGVCLRTTTAILVACCPGCGKKLGGSTC